MKGLALSRPRKCWLLVGAGITLVAAFSAIPAWAQDAARKTVGITPLISNVATISAEEATELFINTLMESNRFAIKPPEANGAFVGVDYVFEATISEGKMQSNALSFLKDTVTSNTPVNLTVRVFDPKSNSLVNSVTVKSSDTKSEKVNVGDVQSLMGTLGVTKGQSSGGGVLEARLGGLMQQVVDRLVSQLSSGMTSGGVRPGQRTPLTR